MSVHFSLSHNFKRDRISNIPSKPNFLWLNRPCYIITHMCTYVYSVNCTVTSTRGKMWSSILNLITMSKERTRVQFTLHDYVCYIKQCLPVSARHISATAGNRVPKRLRYMCFSHEVILLIAIS